MMDPRAHAETLFRDLMGLCRQAQDKGLPLDFIEAAAGAARLRVEEAEREGKRIRTE